jgi:hypothetical protein
LPESEDVIFLNTPYWGGGCRDIWGSKDIKPLEEIMEQSFKCTNKLKDLRADSTNFEERASEEYKKYDFDKMWLR